MHPSSSTADQPPQEVVKQSFGAQLWPGAIPADDCSQQAPDQHVPEPWVALLAEEHADAAFWQALLTSSKASGEFTVQRAPKATLSLDCESGQQSDFARLVQARARRGAGEHTALRVSVATDCSYPAEAGLCAFLTEHAAGFCELQLVFHGVTCRDRLFLAAPNKYPPCRIPHPPQYPQLRHVTLSLHHSDYEHKQRQLIADIAAFLPQLCSLKVTGATKDHWHRGGLWDQLFTPTIKATHLTHFTTDDQLHYGLLCSLIDHAPSLTHISVGASGCTFDVTRATSYADKVWTVTHLHTRDSSIDIAWLAVLPRCKTGPLHVTSAEDYIKIRASSHQPWAPVVKERMSEWQFDVSRVVLESGDFDTSESQASTLHNTLQLLQAMQSAPGSQSVLELAGWFGTRHIPFYSYRGRRAHDWEPHDVLRVVSDAVPLLPQLRVRVGATGDSAATFVLSDKLLTALLQSGTNIRNIDFADIQLQSDQHAAAAWPWDELWVKGGVCVASLLRLPYPGGQGAPRMVRTDRLVFDTVPTQAECEQMLDRLQHIVWAHNSTDADSTFTVHVQASWSDTDPLQSATTQLQLLNSVNFHTTATRSILCLRSWRMTAPVVAALQHLPHWPNAAVLFGECVWPLEPEQYAQLLPVNVPTCFTEWHFDRPTLESPVGVAMSAGVAARRQELGLPAARVLQASTGGLEAPQDSDPDTESDGYC